MKSPEDFESRLRAYLSDGAQTKAPAGIDSRIEQRLFGPRRGWSMQLIAAAAIVAMAIGLGVGLRTVREWNHGLAGGAPTASPAISPSVVPSGKPPAPPETPTPQPNRGVYPLMAPASIRMVSATIGWAAGSTTDRILRTADGGQHWNDVTPAHARLGTWTTFFLDADNAWVASSLQPGSPSADSTIQIEHSSDGGRTWAQVGVIQPDSGGPAAMDFADRQHGWLLMHDDRSQQALYSDLVAVFGTADGGATWTKLSQADSTGIAGRLPIACTKTSLVFLDATNGWIAGSCGPGGGYLLYATHDGGRSWASVSLRIPAQGTATCDCAIGSLRFWDQQHGGLVLDSAGQDERGYPQNFLYLTSDGGRSWQLGPMLPVNAYSVYFLDGRDLWTLDAKTNAILFSDDAGQRWSTAGTVPTNSNGVVWDFQFVTAQIGWVLGADPGGLPILKTVDGGSTWTTQLAP
jgi:photosystem II stability/assembly factor-like uncharacterized protein